MFDTLIQNASKVLVENAYPLTSLYKFLTDTQFRNLLLTRETDADIVSFFHMQFDRSPPGIRQTRQDQLCAAPIFLPSPLFSNTASDSPR
jgi:hypothetical protein